MWSLSWAMAADVMYWWAARVGLDQHERLDGVQASHKRDLSHRYRPALEGFPRARGGQSCLFALAVRLHPYLSITTSV